MNAGARGGGLVPSNAAAMPRAALLVGVAVAIGLLMLWKGLDDSPVAAGRQAPAITDDVTDVVGFGVVLGDGSAEGSEVAVGRREYGRAELDVAEITVKVHRAAMLRKMQARTVADLVRMAATLEREGP